MNTFLQLIKILFNLKNDSLISTLSDEGKLYEYDDKKVDLNNFNKLSYMYNNGSFEITSLYNGGTFIEELLNNSLSYNQLKNSNFDIRIQFYKNRF